jgi:hypothetical protein
MLKSLKWRDLTRGWPWDYREAVSVLSEGCFRRAYSEVAHDYQ